MSRALHVSGLALGLAAVMVSPQAVFSHDGKRDWYEAGDSCFIISNSHHGFTKESAATKSQQGLETLVVEFRRDRHWSKARMRIEAAKATPKPSLRSAVAEDAILKPDLTTKTSYTQCWEGVIWPYVCTSGAKVCRK